MSDAFQCTYPEFLRKAKKSLRLGCYYVPESSDNKIKPQCLGTAVVHRPGHWVFVPLLRRCEGALKNTPKLSTLSGNNTFMLEFAMKL